MVLDILNQAQGICDWLEAIRNPKLYNTLDDTILHEIRISEDDQFSKARELLARFDSRQHYSFVAEKVINQTTIKEISPQDICKYAKDGLQASDICVMLYSINMGMKQKNPMSCVSFYQVQGNKAKLVKKELFQINSMMPERVQTTTLRCFVKCDFKFDSAKQAFV